MRYLIDTNIIVYMIGDPDSLDDDVKALISEPDALLYASAESAKELVVPERRFVRFLLEQRFVYRTASGNVLPYAKPSNDGLFCVKDYCNHGHFGSYTLVTPQGKLYFAQLRDSILVMI